MVKRRIKLFLFFLIASIIALYFALSLSINNNNRLMLNIKDFVPSDIKKYIKHNFFKSKVLIDENDFLKKENEKLNSRIVDLEKVKNLTNKQIFPQTQFLNLDYSEINIDTLDFRKGKIFGKIKSEFYIETIDNYILLIGSDGKIFHSNYKDNTNITFNSTFHNIDFEIDVTDTMIYENKLYLSFAKINSDCSSDTFFIYRADLNLNSLQFEEFFSQETQLDIDIQYIDNNKNLDCPEIGSRGGRMSIYKQNQKDHLILSIQDEKNSNINYFLPPNHKNDNIFRTYKYCLFILIDLESKEKTIFSSGHRNPTGLLVTKNNHIISSEHGPRGGDELNLIKEGKNYGWPTVSYGEPYENDINQPYHYQKNHIELGFEEPIFSFIPSIGTSQIIELDDSFSDKWEDNLLLASLKDGSIYRIEINYDLNKLVYFERIHLGKRIRDLTYDKKNRIIFLALEDNGGKIGIIKSDENTN